MKNWKTTSAGIAAIAGSIIAAYFAIRNHTFDEATATGCIAGILTGVGLITAKDNNVTGGSVSQ
jgi:putative flippase GtrA